MQQTVPGTLHGASAIGSLAQVRLAIAHDVYFDVHSAVLSENRGKLARTKELLKMSVFRYLQVKCMKMCKKGGRRCRH